MGHFNASLKDFKVAFKVIFKWNPQNLFLLIRLIVTKELSVFYPILRNTFGIPNIPLGIPLVFLMYKYFFFLLKSVKTSIQFYYTATFPKCRGILAC